MDTKNMIRIFDNYIDRFKWLTAPEPFGADESYKWKAVLEFQMVFDLEADNFADVLKEGKLASGNLIDSYMQPFGGLVAMAEKNGEAENIRNMFRRLFADDGGDLNVRQQKIDDFIKSSDEMLDKHYPGSFLYKNDQRSVMGYLWLHDPDHNYMCKNMEANYLANAVEFYDDWGPYGAFKLPVYHRFCDELVTEMKNYSALIEIHNSRFLNHEQEMYPDKELHILAFDMIYCAGRYGLYEGVDIKRHTAEDKRQYLQRKEKAKELAEQLAAAEEDMVLLENAFADAESMLKKGTKVRHKTYGEGFIKGYDDNRLNVMFPKIGQEKALGLSVALGNGIITIASPEFFVYMEKYEKILKSALDIPRRVKSAKDALEPYKDFVD